MELLNMLDFILNHPLNSNRKLTSIMRFAPWQICSRLEGASVVNILLIECDSGVHKKL